MSIDVGKAIGYLDLDMSGFSKGFQTAFNDLRTFNSESSKMSDKLASLGGAFTSAGSTLTKTVTVPIAGIGAAAVGTTAKFETAMSQVQATMGITKDAMAEVGGESVNAMGALEDLAKELGAKTKYSAVEAAEALNFMALAGYDVETSIGMLPTVLQLAAAGGMELATASDMITDAQTALGLSLEETSTMVDQMAKAASKSNTSVAQLGDAILTIGGTAQYMAGGTEEIATVLGVLADNGIKASEAGTHLRNMILKLASPTDDGAYWIKRLGLEIFDTEGKMRSFEEIFGDLGKAMEDFTDEEKLVAFSDLFNARDVASATALLNTSTERWGELRGAILDADGAAAQMADTQLDNLSGQLTILKSGLEGAAIAFGELLLPMVKDVVAAIQSLVDWINNLSDEQKDQIVRIAEIVAVIGPALLIIGKVIAAVSSIVKFVGMLKTGLVALWGVMVANPIGAVIAVIGALVAAFVTLYNTNESFRNFINEVWENIKSIIGNAISAIGDFFTVTVPEKIDEMVQWFTELPGRIGYAIGFAVGTIAKWVADMWESAKAIAPEVIDKIVTFFMELPGKIWQALLDVIAKLGEWMGEAKTWVAENLPGLIESIMGFFSELPGRMVELGKNLLHSLWDGITGAVGWLGEKISGLAGGIVQGFTDAFGGKEASKAMSDSLGSTIDAARNTATSEKLSENRPTTPGNRGGSPGGSTGSGGTQGSTVNNYVFNSPVAVTPTVASKQMKQTAKQMALDI